jgi:PadR family transcriptional regulator, regulatory protein PadR
MKAETLKGHLDMLLLAILHDGPSHGYAVIEELRGRSGEALDLPEGTVYPALHRLQRAGLLASSWTQASGRRRRVYTLTSTGREALESQREEWQGFSLAVGRVLMGGEPWPSSTPA